MHRERMKQKKKNNHGVHDWSWSKHTVFSVRKQNYSKITHAFSVREFSAPDHGHMNFSSTRVRGVYQGRNSPRILKNSSICQVLTTGSWHHRKPHRWRQGWDKQELLYVLYLYIPSHIKLELPGFIIKPWPWALIHESLFALFFDRTIKASETLERKRNSFNGALGGARETYSEPVRHR